MTTIDVDVSYSQLAVYDPSLDRPLNNWTDQHVAQGFSWRPGSVSFKTLDDYGPIAVTVTQTKDPTLAVTATRVIELPFEVPPSGTIEVGSVAEGRKVRIGAGRCRLIFIHYREGDRMCAQLVFEPSDEPVLPRVCRADDELRPREPLLMSAEPA